MALVAPRGLMMYAAYSEHEGNCFGYEQAYRSVRSVYRFLAGKKMYSFTCGTASITLFPTTLRISSTSLIRSLAAVIIPKSETWINGYTFEGWLNASGERIDPLQHPQRTLWISYLRTPSSWPRRREDIRKEILWAHGRRTTGAAICRSAHIARARDALLDSSAR